MLITNRRAKQKENGGKTEENEEAKLEEAAAPKAMLAIEAPKVEPKASVVDTLINGPVSVNGPLASSTEAAVASATVKDQWLGYLPRSRSEEDRELQRAMALSLGQEIPPSPPALLVPSKANQILNGNDSTMKSNAISSESATENETNSLRKVIDKNSDRIKTMKQSEDKGTGTTTASAPTSTSKESAEIQSETAKETESAPKEDEKPKEIEMKEMKRGLWTANGLNPLTFRTLKFCVFSMSQKNVSSFYGEKKKNVNAL